MEYINKHKLDGDAPGAAPVKVVVDGRELTIPRMDILLLLNKAALQATEEMAEASTTPIKEHIRKGETIIQAIDRIREWYDYNSQMCETATALSRFLSSR